MVLKLEAFDICKQVSESLETLMFCEIHVSIVHTKLECGDAIFDNVEGLTDCLPPLGCLEGHIIDAISTP
jgi:hypothetical protein